MATNLYLPTLTQDGWVTSTTEQADYLVAHFFESEFSQTNLYGNNVSSFPYIIQNAQGDITRTVGLLKNTLLNYFGRYFKNVTVDCDASDNGTSKVTINLYVSFQDAAGKTFELSRLLDLVDSKVSRIVKINNTGQV